MSNKRFDNTPKFIVGDDPVIIQKDTVSTANVFETKDFSGTTKVSISADGVLTASGLSVTGDLTVDGTTTTINSTTLTVDDKNIVLGDVSSPTDTTANGGGITLKGATDKTIAWSSTTGSWMFDPSAIFTTIAGNGRALGIAGGSGDTAGILQFLNNASTAQWASITATSGQLNMNATTGVDVFSDSLRIEKTNSGGNGPMLRLENKSNTGGTRAGIFFGVDVGSANWSDAGNAEIIGENSGQSNYGILRFYVFDSLRSEAMKIVGHGINYQAAENAAYNLRNGVAFGSAGIAIDKGWNGYPGINVFNANAYGDTRQQEFRFHGWNRSFSSYPDSSGSDFGVNIRIDGASYLTSDARVKTNIIDNPYGLNEILALKPRKFDRINSRGEIEANTSNMLGFIAQEVIGIIPEAVKYYEDEDVPNEIGWCRAYSLNEGPIISTLVKAVQEQNILIKTLEARIVELEN